MSASNGVESATVIGSSCETGWYNFDATCAFSVVADIRGPSMTIQANWTGFFLPDRSGSLVVDLTPAPFDVGVADATRLFGQPDPAFEMLYYGFKLDDDASIMGTPTFFSEAMINSPPGTYLVWPDQGVVPQAGYYQLNGGFPGTLTITGTDAPLVVDLPTSVVFGDGNLVVGTTDEYGRDIAFSASGACEYNGGGAIDFVAVGTCNLEMTATGSTTGITDATASASIEVLPAPVQVSWSYQEPIRLGDATPNTMWNAEVDSSYSGTWSYDVPELAVGYNTITATFTPDASLSNYTSGSATYELLVLANDLSVAAHSAKAAVAGTPFTLEAVFADCSMQCQFHWFVDGVEQGYQFVEIDSGSIAGFGTLADDPADGYFDAVSHFDYSYAEGQHAVRVEAVDVDGYEMSAQYEVSATAAPAAPVDPVAPAVPTAPTQSSEASAAPASPPVVLPNTALPAPATPVSPLLASAGLLFLLGAGALVLRNSRRAG